MLCGADQAHSHRDLLGEPGPCPSCCRWGGGHSAAALCTFPGMCRGSGGAGAFWCPPSLEGPVLPTPAHLVHVLCCCLHTHTATLTASVQPPAPWPCYAAVFFLPPPRAITWPRPPKPSPHVTPPCSCPGWLPVCLPPCLCPCMQGLIVSSCCSLCCQSCRWVSHKQPFTEMFFTRRATC